MSDDHDFSNLTSFNDHTLIDKNRNWLKENMPKAFFQSVSEPWQTVIANQLILLPAHDGLDHLMSKNEACIITTLKDFDLQTICKIYSHFFIESFEKFISKTPYQNTSTLTIIFLKLSSTIPHKESLEALDHVAVNASFKEISLSFSTLTPHSIHKRLFKFLKGIKNSLDHLKCHLTQYHDGYYIQLSFKVDEMMNETHLGVLRTYLKSSFQFEQVALVFEAGVSLVIDALGVLNHQILCQIQPDRFSLKNFEETFLKYHELIHEETLKFLDHVNPKSHSKHLDLSQLETKVKSLDTGNALDDEKRKMILSLYLTLLKGVLKTNYYVADKKALSFRLDPSFLRYFTDLHEKFPEIPYGIFFIKGEGFFGFHIRFKDLSRGGLRTVLSRTKEQAQSDVLSVFSECYGLSFTQQRKNKDIPEGGAKGIIFVDLHKLFDEESTKNLQNKENFFTSYRSFCQILSQKRYILALLDLVNADEKGHLRNKDIVDFLKKPEHLFLGPDENMTDPMITWIAETSLKKNYSTKTAFISSKPRAGINHKTYGVTSYGVNAYMDEALKFLKIDPTKHPFTIKISGGPDGEVAGNQMINLKKYYPNTAKLVAVTDVSGTIYDPEGLDLNLIEKLFLESKPIRFYPHKALHPGGYLLDLQTRKKTEDLAELTLLVKNEQGKIREHYLAGTEMSLLFRQNLHQVKADIFIPAGGRPRTLNEYNVQEFLDKDLKPSSKAIIEGANLYLTPKARRFLEEKGVLIFKDSSANKGGVICSSYEVIAGLCLTDEQFMLIKEDLVHDILALIKQKSQSEARVLLESFAEKLGYMTDLSDEISKKINTYKYELLDSLESKTLSSSPDDPLNKLIVSYVPKVIRKETSPSHILSSLSDIHKKAIVACHLASNVVYLKGLKWNPGISELLPLLIEDKEIH
jgi:glutamate dehydrogenase